MIRLPWRRAPQHPHHNSWLVLIALFKLAQAALFAAIGVGALKLLHKDVGDELAQLADHLHFNPEWRLVNLVIEQADRLDDNLLRRIGAIFFIEAGLDLAEGIGLYLEKVWAEYLTLLITGSFLPWEVFEVFRRVTLVRVGLFSVNFLVFAYLFKLLLERRRSREEISSTE
jgi:uncharacterized membrane protein (DUF2068 family)